MSKVFAILVEPANYTLATIEKVYKPRGVDFAYLFGESKASSVKIDALSDKSFWTVIRYLWRVLKEYDAFVINDYTRLVNLEFIFLNLLFWRKPFALESDTELRIPSNLIKRLMKWVWLRFLFTRRCCYGFPGGFCSHRELFLHYGMSADHVITMPMQVDNQLYACDKGLNGKYFTFGYLGRLVGHKNVDKIVEAVRIVDAPIEMVVNVIGDGEDRKQLEGVANGLPVKFSGALFGESKTRALHAFDCLILPSSYEPWGLVINEALASGIPVIVSDSVGCRHDLVEATDTLGETGMVVKTGDVEALAAAMTKMCSDKELWQKFHENALKRMEYWNYDLYGKQFDKWVARISV